VLPLKKRYDSGNSLFEQDLATTPSRDVDLGDMLTDVDRMMGNIDKDTPDRAGTRISLCYRIDCNYIYIIML
jgi:hypothetical protein